MEYLGERYWWVWRMYCEDLLGGLVEGVELRLGMVAGG